MHPPLLFLQQAGSFTLIAASLWTKFIPNYHQMLKHKLCITLHQVISDNLCFIKNVCEMGKLFIVSEQHTEQNIDVALKFLQFADFGGIHIIPLISYLTIVIWSRSWSNTSAEDYSITRWILKGDISGKTRDITNCYQSTTNVFRIKMIMLENSL